MKKNKKNEDSTLEPDIPYDGDTNVKKKQSLSDKVTIMKNQVRDFLLDHPKTNFVCSNAWILLLSLISAFIFAYGFLAFTNPLRVPFTSILENQDSLNQLVTAYKATGATEIDNSALKSWYNSLDYNTALSIVGKHSLVSGGASGFSQVVTRILSFTGMFKAGSGIEENTIISILYIAINIPFLILAWTKIGKKFTIYTLLNIGFSSMFLKIIPASWCEITNIYTDYLARALAGGICTGLGTGIAFAVGSSTGAVDIISLFFAEKKSTSVGKYSMVLNTITVVTYTLLHFILSPSDVKFQNDLAGAAWNQGVHQTTMALYTIVYFFVGAKLLDLINIKNKKVELQVFTADPNMAKVLISGFPHACTLVSGIGGFTGTPRHIIYMVVSKSELNRAIKVMREADPNCFVSVLSTYQVYGKFYIKPLD